MELRIADLEEWSLRESPIKLQELVDSFSTHGQLSPIKVRKHPEKPSKYQIIFGNRRVAAAKSLGWSTIAGDIIEASDSQIYEIAFTENEERQDFSDFEKGMLLRKMHQETGLPYLEIAQHLGKSKAYVSQHIAMTDVFSDVEESGLEKTKVACALTESHARLLLRIANPSERWNTAKLAVAAKLSTRELERFVPRKTNRAKRLRCVSSEKSIAKIIDDIVLGLNNKDMRPYLETRSRRWFTMFDDFPPLERLNQKSAMEHNFSVLSHTDDLKLSVEDLEIRVFKKCACATLFVLYEMGRGVSKVVTKSRVTLIFSWENGWRIVHEHWSNCDPQWLTRDHRGDGLLGSA